MNTSIQPAGFIIVDPSAMIYGYGYTANAAWENFGDYMRESRVMVVGDDADVYEEPICFSNWTRKSEHKCVAASAKLITAVNEAGGDAPWTTVNGVACTDEEERAVSFL